MGSFKKSTTSAKSFNKSKFDISPVPATKNQIVRHFGARKNPSPAINREGFLIYNDLIANQEADLIS